MSLNRRKVKATLEDKGFRKRERDHTFFIYFTENGEKTPVLTKMSHGSNHREISDEFVSRMAKQCKLTTKEFTQLVECPLSREEYEEKLKAKNAI